MPQTMLINNVPHTFISMQESKDRENIIRSIYSKFFKNTSFNEEQANKLAELAGVKKVKINTCTGEVISFDFGVNKDYSNFKTPKISKEELNNPTIKTLDDLNAFRNRIINVPIKEETKKPEDIKKEDPKKEIKEKETVKETKKPEDIKKEDPKKEVIVTNITDEKLLVDNSNLTDKWNEKTVTTFNEFLNSVKQIEKYSDNEKQNNLIKDNFNNLKLIGFKGRFDGYMTCVVYNINTNVIFELFRKFDKEKNTTDIEITTFVDVFDYKSMIYKRQSEARQKQNKKERDEYLNQFCYIDFKLLPKEEKLA